MTPRQYDTFTKSIRQVGERLAIAVLVIGGCVPGSVAAADDATFREFPDAEVAGPPELFRSLIKLSVDLPESLATPDQTRLEHGHDPSQPDSSPPLLERLDQRSLAERLANPNKHPALTDDLRRRINEPPDTASSRGEILKRIQEAYSRAQRQDEFNRIGDASRFPPIPTDRVPLSQLHDAGRSGPADAVLTENDGFRDRMNRILLQAAEDSLARNSNDASQLNVLERTFQRIAESAKDRLDEKSPDWRRRMGRKLKSLDSRLVQSSASSVALWRGSSSSAPSLTRPSHVTTWLVGLLLAVLAVVVWRRLAAHVARQPPSLLKKLRIKVKSIDSRQDLILAVDEFLISRLGRRSDSWNCQMMKESLCAAHPEHIAPIVMLVDDYELARYAPKSTAISRSRLQRCSATLRQLVNIATPNDESASLEEV